MKLTLGLVETVNGLDEGQVMLIHYELHKAFAQWKNSGFVSDGYTWTKEDFFNTHKMIVERMGVLGLDHGIKDELDELTMPKKNERVEIKTNDAFITLEMVLGRLKGFKAKDFISIDGELVNKGKTSGPVEVVIEGLEAQICGMIKWPVRVFTAHIPGSYIPIFHAEFPTRTPSVKTMTDNGSTINPGVFFKFSMPKEYVYGVGTLSSKTLELPTVVQKLQKGVRVQIHKVDGQAFVWNEQGENLAHKLPVFVNMILAKEAAKIMLDGIIFSKDVEMKAEGLLKGQEPVLITEGSKLQVQILDVLWWVDDIHGKLFTERLALMSEKFNGLPCCSVEGTTVFGSKDIMLNYLGREEGLYIINKEMGYKKSPDFVGEVLEKVYGGYTIGFMMDKAVETRPADVVNGNMAVVGKVNTTLNLEVGDHVIVNTCGVYKYPEMVRLSEMVVVDKTEEGEWNLKKVLDTSESCGILHKMTDFEEEKSESYEAGEKGLILGDQKIELAVWSAAYVNTLPDAAFAIILSGGKKDGEGKTTPRSLRKLPHHKKSVASPNDDDSVDKAHLRNALARVGQTNASPEQISRARSHLEGHAKRMGIGQHGKLEWGVSDNQMGEVWLDGEYFSIQKIERIILTDEEVEKWPEFTLEDEGVWTRCLPGIDESKSEFRFRVQDTSLFDKFRQKPLGSGGIYAVYGHQKSGGKWVIQSLRFKKASGWTKEKVSKWLNAHEYMENGYKIVEEIIKAQESLIEQPLFGTVVNEKEIWLVEEGGVPYVLSQDALTSDFIPKMGMSCLSKEERDKVPLEYQWWKLENRAERLKVRGEYIKKISTNFKIVELLDGMTALVDRDNCRYLAKMKTAIGGYDVGKEVNYLRIETLTKIKDELKDFTLSHHWWKESTSHWDLFIGDEMMVLTKEPIGSSKGFVRRPYSKSSIDKGKNGPEFLPPMSNENKTSLLAWMERKDNGKVILLDNTPTCKRFNFMGKVLNGTYEMVREREDVNDWKWRKVPVGKMTLSKDESVVKGRMMLSVSNFGKKGDGKFHVIGSAFSYGVWNGEWYSPEVVSDRPERINGIPVCVGPHDLEDNDGSVVGFKLEDNTIVVDTVIENSEKQKEVENGNYVGFSVEIEVLVDNIRHMVKKIMAYDRVNVVANPACEVCKIADVVQ